MTASLCIIQVNDGIYLCNFGHLNILAYVLSSPEEEEEEEGERERERLL